MKTKSIEALLESRALAPRSLGMVRSSARPLVTSWLYGSTAKVPWDGGGESAKVKGKESVKFYVKRERGEYGEGGVG